MQVIIHRGVFLKTLFFANQNIYHLVISGGKSQVSSWTANLNLNLNLLLLVRQLQQENTVCRWPLRSHVGLWICIRKTMNTLSVMLITFALQTLVKGAKAWGYFYKKKNICLKTKISLFVWLYYNKHACRVNISELRQCSLLHRSTTLGYIIRCIQYVMCLM